MSQVVDFLRALFMPSSVPHLRGVKPPDVILFERAQEGLRRSSARASKEADVFGRMLDDMRDSARKKRRRR